MMAIMSFLKSWKFIGLVIIVAVAALIFFLTRGQGPSYELAAVKRGDVVQEVSVTGRVKPAESVDLAFDTTGRVAQIYANVGDRVSRGRILVALESSELSAQLGQAEAALESAKIQLAQQNDSLANARQNLTDQLNDAFTKADDAVRNKVDQFFLDPRGASPQLAFFINETQLEIEVESGRRSVETLLTEWAKSPGDLAAVKANLDGIKSFLDKTALAVNRTTNDTWKSALSAARTNVNTAISNLTAAEEKVKNAESAVSLQEAKIKEAEANVDYNRSRLAKSRLPSPISGIVTRQEAKVGEIVSAQTVVVSVISEARFEIEANIPEVDVAKIKIGDSARVTLDAYRTDVVWEAVVSEIDPAETVIDGVPTYKTVFQFQESDDRIKSGMTANIDVLTAKKEGVLSIPQRAVVSEDGRGYVRVLQGKNVQQVDVVTGLRGSEGTVEIVSGLAEGDEVIVFER